MYPQKCHCQDKQENSKLGQIKTKQILPLKESLKATLQVEAVSGS